VKEKLTLEVEEKLKSIIESRRKIEAISCKY